MLFAAAVLVSGCARLGLGNGAVELDEARRTWCYEHSEAIAREWRDDDDVVFRAALFEWPLLPTSTPCYEMKPTVDATGEIFIDWGYPTINRYSRESLDIAAADFREMAPSATHSLVSAPGTTASA
jgi:hypothetical protein